MSEWVLELAERLIVGRKRDGQCVYDAQAKQELILACGRPGISMAKLARDCGINANLLSTWVRKHERKAAALPAPAVVATVAAVAMGGVTNFFVKEQSPFWHESYREPLGGSGGIAYVGPSV